MMIAAAGELINARPLGAQLPIAKTSVLARGEKLEVVRLVVPAGKEISAHAAAGWITVFCLEGRVEFECQEKTHEMTAGNLLFLEPHATHALRGREDASLLVNLFREK